MKPRWNKKPCGCVKADLPQSGRVMIRCDKHRGKPSKRTLAYFDQDGIVKAEPDFWRPTGECPETCG